MSLFLIKEDCDDFDVSSNFIIILSNNEVFLYLNDYTMPKVNSQRDINQKNSIFRLEPILKTSFSVSYCHRNIEKIIVNDRNYNATIYIVFENKESIKIVRKYKASGKLMSEHYVFNVFSGDDINVISVNNQILMKDFLLPIEVFPTYSKFINNILCISLQNSVLLFNTSQFIDNKIYLKKKSY